MGRRVLSVREIAREAGVDVDVALLTLWDSGLLYLADPDDRVRKEDTARARRAIGLATAREMRTPGYWAQVLGLDDAEFGSLLASLGIQTPAGSKRLPKGAVGKLRRHAKRSGDLAKHQFEKGQATASPRTDATQVAVAPFRWVVRGHKRVPGYILTAPDVERIHWALVQDFAKADDPIDPPGVASSDLLESAVHRVETALGETSKYPTVEMAAAALLHSIIHNHPFHNGNKRTALVSMLVALDLGGLVLTCTQDEVFRFVLQVAQHRVVPSDGGSMADREVIAITDWICQYSRLKEAGERPLPWRKLRRILVGYGCELDHPRGVGNRINISRTIERKGRLGRVRRQTLALQVAYGDEGREVARNTISEIRRSLQLDADHGIDSYVFYSKGGEPVDDFIVEYSQTLKRLARL